MKWIRRLFMVVLVAAAMAGGYWFYQNRIAVQGSSTATDGYTQVVTAQRGNLSASLTVVGELEAIQHETLTFERLAGTTVLQSLAVQAGNTVTAGQVLATVDPAPYKQALDQARSDLQAAEEKLADLKTPATAQETAAADVKVAQAEHDLEQAKEDLAKLQSPDLTALQEAVQTARDNLAVAKYQQALAERDSLAKSERDLQYAVNWHERKIGQLQQSVAEHKANLEQTEQLADEQEKLGDAQADLARVQAQRQVSRQSAALAVTEAQQSLVDAEEALAEAKAGGDALALAKAQLAVRDAEVALAAAKEDRAKLDEGTDATTLAAAQADLDKKRLAVTEAEEDLAGTNLVAPFDGTVLQTHTTAGSNIAANSSIVTLANLKGLQVVASVDETTIRQVSVGQKAQISFDAFPGQTFSGQVLEVPLQGTLQGNVMVYEVLVSLVGAEKLSLLVGMTANVQISMGSVENGLLVPTMALQKVGGM
ncbi:MAG: efflux RND transporter periplasmic adaptor subunit, partial [Anaerolineae bacterium]|nr:efflux RND transporter periplasmic adaptor subunit [Anaerolineae bacterium]